MAINTIRFHHDKHGRDLAFKWLHSAGRWCKMNYDEAKLLEATEAVSQVYYGPNCWQPGKFEFNVLRESEHMTTTEIVKVAD